jgi:hypothetical protein
MECDVEAFVEAFEVGLDVIAAHWWVEFGALNSTQ